MKSNLKKFIVSSFAHIIFDNLIVKTDQSMGVFLDIYQSNLTIVETIMEGVISDSQFFMLNYSNIFIEAFTLK